MPTRLLHRLRNSVPLSARGALVALFSGSALWLLGYGTLDLLLFVVGISGLVLVALSSILVGSVAIYLRRRPDGRSQPRPASAAARRLEAGSPILTGFRLPACSRIPLIKIHWRWLYPEEVECRVRLKGGELLEEVIAGRRCQVAIIRRRLTVFDAFGLSRVSWEHQAPTSLTVLPDVGRLRRTSVVQSMSSAEGLPHPQGAPEGDRMEIRRYVPGDSVRHILWKTFARTRQLNVRIPERSIEVAKKTVAYLLTGPGDEPAAAAARVALETGVFGIDWLFGADGTDQPVDTLEPALDAIARSGSAGAAVDGANGHDNPADGSGGLSAFLRNPRVRGEVHCVIFAPGRGGTWMEQALAATRNFSGAVSFVLATDGLVRAQTAPLWRRWLFVTESQPEATTEELSGLLRTVAATGYPTLIVDRRSGKSFGPEGQRALVTAG
ncbi:MAG: DUF58 domain-containing protein [Thermoanaerobaculia bacterium]